LTGVGGVYAFSKYNELRIFCLAGNASTTVLVVVATAFNSVIGSKRVGIVSGPPTLSLVREKLAMVCAALTALNCVWLITVLCC
jgi:hypothetical protein